MKIDDIKKQAEYEELEYKYKQACKKINEDLFWKCVAEFKTFFTGSNDPNFTDKTSANGLTIYYKGASIYTFSNSPTENTSLNVSVQIMNEKKHKATAIFTTSDIDYPGMDLLTEAKRKSNLVDITEDPNKRTIKYYTAVVNGEVKLTYHFHVGKNVYDTFTELLEKETF
jgi:hypothetical protein